MSKYQMAMLGRWSQRGAGFNRSAQNSPLSLGVWFGCETRFPGNTIVGRCLLRLAVRAP
jgi:hypothetical protein